MGMMFLYWLSENQLIKPYWCTSTKYVTICTIESNNWQVELRTIEHGTEHPLTLALSHKWIVLDSTCIMLHTHALYPTNETMSHDRTSISNLSSPCHHWVTYHHHVTWTSNGSPCHMNKQCITLSHDWAMYDHQVTWLSNRSPCHMTEQHITTSHGNGPYLGSIPPRDYTPHISWGREGGSVWWVCLPCRADGWERSGLQERQVVM